MEVLLARRPIGGGVPIFEAKADLFRAIAHPARIRALEILGSGEQSVGDLAGEVGLEASHLSQQLGILRRAGLVSTRRDGSSVYYSIREPLLIDLLAVARRLLISSLSQSQELLADLKSLEAS